jgi:hypothetical protein
MKTIFSKQVSSKKTIYFVRTAFERKKSVTVEEVLIFNMYDLSKIKWEFLLPSFERTVIEE